MRQLPMLMSGRKTASVAVLITIATCAFVNVFGQAPQMNVTQVSPSRQKDEWDFYLTKIDDRPASILVNLSLMKAAPVRDKPNLLRVRVNLNNPRTDGLSSSEEMNMLEKVEDHLIEKLLFGCQSVYTGRMTTAGHRSYFFYLGDTSGSAAILAKAQSAFPKYPLNCSIQSDKEWNEYLNTLYPGPAEYQMILNRRLVGQLEEHGDDHSRPRDVFHWIQFKTEQDREKFISKIQPEGFNIIEKKEDPNERDFRYSLQIAREDKVDLISVNEYALHLWDLAGECKGSYDGWETTVER